MNTLLSIGPLNLTPYGLAVLTGVLAGVLLCLLNKKIFPLLPLTILGAVVLGHAFWVFLRLDGYMDEVSSFAFMFQPWLGGYTLYGALIGGALGALAGAKLSGIRPLEALDSLAPAACAVLFFCRIGEYYTGEGVGAEALESLSFFPIASTGLNDGFWLYAVWFWEAVAALIILVILLFRRKKAQTGELTVLFTTLLGTSQILLEQFRKDNFVRLNSFVRFTQIAAILTLLALMICLVIRRKPGKAKAGLSFAVLAVATGALVFAEFVFDKPQMEPLLYITMIATAVLFGILLIHFRGEAGKLSAGFFALFSGILVLLYILATADPDASGFQYTILLDLMMLSSLTAIGVTLMTLYHTEPALPPSAS